MRLCFFLPVVLDDTLPDNSETAINPPVIWLYLREYILFI